MPRPNPLNTRLPKDWKETITNILTVKAGYGRDALNDINEILAHDKSEDAVKYLDHASNGDENLLEEALAKAFAACLGARTMSRLHRKGTTESITTSRATQISERTPNNKFSIYDVASSRTKDKYPHPRLDNDTIIAALRIGEDLLDSLSWEVKGANATGRPVDGHRRSLVIYLTTMFREHFGTPLSGAVAGLVSATFPTKAALTAKAVRDMLRKQ